MPTRRTEVRDGKTYVVTVLPADKRLQPAESRKRALFAALSSREKRQYIDARIGKAKRRKRRKRGSGGS